MVVGQKVMRCSGCQNMQKLMYHWHTWTLGTQQEFTSNTYPGCMHFHLSICFSSVIVLFNHLRASARVLERLPHVFEASPHAPTHCQHPQPTVFEHHYPYSVAITHFWTLTRFRLFQVLPPFSKIYTHFDVFSTIVNRYGALLHVLTHYHPLSTILRPIALVFWHFLTFFNHFRPF